MNSTIRVTVSAVLGVAGVALSQVSAAQVAPQSSGSEATALETVVVTADKREESLQNVPMSVTALGGAMLNNLQASDFADYASLVPGLALNSAQPGQTRLTLHGQNAGGAASTVAVYLDESPFGSSTGLVNGAIDTGDFDTWDMQRIEVLRGPQGTLYGANSEGGLLKFVTNAPQLGKFSTAGEVGGEDVSHGGNGWDARGMVNIPAGDQFAFRVSGFYDDIPGFIDDPALGTKNINEGKKYGGRASLLFAPTKDFSVLLTAAAQTSTYDGINTVDVNPVTLKPLYGDLTQERVVPEPSMFQYQNYSGTIDWNVGPFRVVSITSYGTLDTNTVTDGTPIYGGDAAAFGGTGAPLDAANNLNKFTQEIRLQSPASDRLEWQVGAFYTHEKAALIQNLNAVTAPNGPVLALLIQPVIDSTYTEGAGFLNLTYHFTSQFDLQAGGRWSHNSQDATQTTTFNAAFGVPTQTVNGNSSENVWTYSVAPSWHFDKSTMAYARLATGYRPGGPNVLPPNAPPTVPHEYGSDQTTNFELGVRSTQLDGRLSLDVALYHVDWKNIQILEVVNGFNINANAGTARTEGVEWNFAYVPLQGLTFQWTGAYSDALLTSDAPTLGAFSGNRLPWVPKWSTAIDAEYKHAAFGNFDAFVGGTWSYVGEQSSDFASSATTPPGQLVLPTYSTYGARLGLENDRYRITLYGKNLSNSRGITNYTSNGSPYSTITVTQPLTVGLSLSAKF